MRNNFEGAEMTIYTADGEELNFELSAMQVFVTMKILGFNFESSSSYSCYGDETLKQFFEFKGNPLRLKPVE